MEKSRNTGGGQKEELYRNYVSHHNTYLYGEAEAGVRSGQISAWTKYYGKLLPTDKAARIIDIGCGDGKFVKWLHDLGYGNAEGIDVSVEQVDVAKRSGISGVTHADVGEYLKEAKGRYHIVFLRDVLGHFKKDEVRRVVDLVYGSLEPGGVVVVKTPNAESPMTGQLRYGDFTHDTSFTRSSMRQVLLASDFTDVSVYGNPPVVHGIKSLVRFVLWKCIECCLRFYRLVESGSAKGIFTQNIIAVGRKGNSR